MIAMSQQETKVPALDTLIWVLAISLSVAGIYAYYHLVQQPWVWRTVGATATTVVVLFLVSLTQAGKAALQLVVAARMEMRKVVWPTRQETMQSTITVLVMVFIAAILLWCIDTAALKVVAWLTGQRG